MRVCDITREDEVVKTVKIDLIPLRVEGNVETIQFEVGQRALDAIKAGAWGQLQQLIPPALRVKDSKRAKAGQKAAATRKANAAQEATTTATDAPAAPQANKGSAAAPAPEGSWWLEAPVEEVHSGDPGF